MGLAVRVDATGAKPDTPDYHKQYPTLFKGLGNLGEPYEIHLKTGALPHCIFTSRHVPLPLRDKVKEELDKMEEMGIINKIDEPTQWCAGMVVVPKKNGKIRICVDLKPLNECILREIHPLPKVDETLAQLSGAKVFSKLDANSGFWQIPLEKRSQKLTTFITPFGRYHFTKMPFGISSAPEHFQKRMSSILSDLDGVQCLMDDVLIYGKDEKEHDVRLTKTLERIQAAGATLNPEKCEFKKRELKFLGHIVNAEGIKADPEKVSAITEMDAPTSVSELRRFMGMVNQLGKFSPNLAELTQPLRQLLSKGCTWLWESEQELAFCKVKEELLKPTVLAMYSPKAPTKISADASSYGLGAVIMQESKPNEWKPIAYASRSLTETETRYAQIEKEALAVTWACDKFSTYVLGMKFCIETDHKPLVPLLGCKRLDSLPPRVLRFRLRLARYDYDIKHIPGKLLYTADALSRKPSSHQSNDQNLETEVESSIETCVATLPASPHRLSQIQQAQMEDETCYQAIKYTKEGWPEKKTLDNKLLPFWKARGYLTVDKNGLLIHDSRIVIPDILRTDTLEKLHSGHQGIERCRLRARTLVWWPGVSREIENMIKQCPHCAKRITPRRAPMIATPLPQYPWQKIGVDLCHLDGSNYLIVVDYFSRYPEAVKIKSTTAEAVINQLKLMFSRFGIPEILQSDNGPQFSSQQFVEFAEAYGFTHNTSSPYFAQSNGQVERTVQTVKRLLKESNDPYIALLTYRSTPFSWCQLSPAELLMGRKIRTNIPLLESQLIPNWEFLEQFYTLNKSFKAKQKKAFDHRHRVRDQSPIPDDTEVWVTSGEQPIPGRVVRSADTPRSYIVATPSGEVRRNRQHLNVVPPHQSQRSRPPETAPIRDPIITHSRSGTLIQPPNRF